MIFKKVEDVCYTGGASKRKGGNDGYTGQPNQTSDSMFENKEMY